MTLTAALGIYFVLWWLVLFAVLPWGIRSQHEEGAMEPGVDPGAPVRPRLLQKAIVTTVVSAILFAAGWAASGPAYDLARSLSEPFRAAPR